jgi:dTDP-4-amino-4,6-dideoxygalactose transaminase
VRFPHADHVSDCGIWLPSHFRLAEDDVGRVAEAIRAVVGNAPARVAPTPGAHPAQMAM